MRKGYFDLIGDLKFKHKRFEALNDITRTTFVNIHTKTRISIKKVTFFNLWIACKI